MAWLNCSIDCEHFLHFAVDTLFFALFQLTGRGSTLSLRAPVGLLYKDVPH